MWCLQALQRPQLRDDIVKAPEISGLTYAIHETVFRGWQPLESDHGNLGNGHEFAHNLAYLEGVTSIRLHWVNPYVHAQND